MKKRMVVTALLTLLCVMSLGCGLTNSSSSASQQDVDNFVSLLASSATGALDASAGAQDVRADVLKKMQARILRAMPAHSLRNLNVHPETLQITCNSNQTACQFYDNENVSYSCQTGGTMSLALLMSGTGTATSAYLSIQTIASVNDWTCDGPSITTFPGGVTINGTFDYPADTVTVTMGGGFTQGGQSCSLNVTVNGNADGSGDISGTACGNSINASF